MDNLTSALRHVSLPGRFQRHGKFIFDVAHNPEGARAVATTIAASRPPSPIVAVLSVLSDKDWKGIILELGPAIDRFVMTNAPSAPSPRKWDVTNAFDFAIEHGFAADAEPEFDLAIDRAQDTAATVLVTGSFHTVGDAMSRLQVSPFAA